MSRVPKWKIEKAKVKVVFRLQFHATNIPSTGWDKLFLSFISADTGKVTAKTNKANVRNGSCKWPDPIYEATRLLQDSRTKTYDDKLYKLVVAMGTSRSSILGEVDVNLAEFAEALKPVSIALPFRGCDFGAVLHVTAQLLSTKTGFREFEQQRETGARSSQQLVNQRSHDPSEVAAASSDIGNDKANGRNKIKETSLGLPLPEGSVASTEDYENSSHTSDGYFAEKNDPCGSHEISSFRHSGDLPLCPTSQSPTPEKGPFQGKRLSPQGSNDWSHGWSPEYSASQDLAAAHEENNRLKTRLEVAESAFSQLKSESMSLQDATSKFGTETQSLANQLAVELMSRGELTTEVSFLRTECSNLKRELGEMKSAKLLQHKVDGEVPPMADSSEHDLQTEWLQGLLLLESKLQQTRNNALHGLQASDLDFLLADIGAIQRVIENLKQGVQPGQMKENYREHLVPPSDLVHQSSLGRDHVTDKKNSGSTGTMEEKMCGLLQKLEDSKTEKENLLEKMSQMERYYESFILKLEETQKQTSIELENLRKEHNSCFYTVSVLQAQKQKMHEEMNDQLMRFVEDRTALEAQNKEFERRAVATETALKRVRWNYSAAVDRLQKDLELLSFQVLSMYESHETLAKQSIVEDTESFPEEHSAIADIHGINENDQDMTIGKQFGPEGLHLATESQEFSAENGTSRNFSYKMDGQKNLRRALKSEELRSRSEVIFNLDSQVNCSNIGGPKDASSTMESEILETFAVNIECQVFSDVLRESHYTALDMIKQVQGRLYMLEKQLRDSDDARESLVLKLNSALDQSKSLKESESGYIFKCDDLTVKNQILEAKLQDISVENALFMEKLVASERLVEQHKICESKYNACTEEKKRFEDLLVKESRQTSQLKDELRSVMEDFYGMKDELRNQSLINEHQIVFTSLEEQLSILCSKLVSLSKDIGISCFDDVSVLHELQNKNYTSVIASLEFFQQQACQKVLHLHQENEALEEMCDVLRKRSDMSGTELLDVKQKFDCDMAGTIEKLNISEGHVEKLQQELQEMEHKVKIISEAHEKHSINNGGLTSKLAQMEVELQIVISENETLVEKMKDIASVVQELERTKVSLAESDEDNKTLAQSLQAKDELLMHMENETRGLQNCLSCTEENLLSERRLREDLESALASLTSQLGEKDQVLLSYNEDKTELLRLRDQILDMRKENSLMQDALSQSEQIKRDLSCKNCFLHSQLSNAENQLATILENLLATEIEASYMRSQVEDVGVQLDFLRNDIGKLQLKNKDTDELLRAHMLSVAELTDRNGTLESAIYSQEINLARVNKEKEGLEELIKRNEQTLVSTNKSRDIPVSINNSDAVLKYQDEILQLRAMQTNLEEHVDGLRSMKDEVEILNVVLKSKLEEQHTEMSSLLQDSGYQMTNLKEQNSELTRKLAEQTLKAEEFKNLSIHLRELKEKAEAGKKEKEGSVFAMQESLRIAFIKEQYESKVQELKSQVFVSKKYSEEMLLKLQTALDEVETGRKNEIALAKRIEELSMKVSELEVEMQDLSADKRELSNAYDSLMTDLECTKLNLDCCKEEKQKTEACLQECSEERSRTRVELDLVKKLLENMSLTDHIASSDNSGSCTPGATSIGQILGGVKSGFEPELIPNTTEVDSGLQDDEGGWRPRPSVAFTAPAPHPFAPSRRRHRARYLQAPTSSRPATSGAHHQRAVGGGGAVVLLRSLSRAGTAVGQAAMGSAEGLVEIRPRELQFLFEVKKQSSCSIHLVNQTDEYVAFKVKTTSPKKYCVRPNIGVILPRATCVFTVTMQAQKTAPPDLQIKDKFLVQTTAIPAGITDEGTIPAFFFKETGRYVEENKLRVVLVSATRPEAEQLISGMPNVKTAIEVPVAQEALNMLNEVPNVVHQVPHSLKASFPSLRESPAILSEIPFPVNKIPTVLRDFPVPLKEAPATSAESAIRSKGSPTVSVESQFSSTEMNRTLKETPIPRDFRVPLKEGPATSAEYAIPLKGTPSVSAQAQCSSTEMKSDISVNTENLHSFRIEDVENMKSELTNLEVKLEQAEILIVKLREEARTSIQERDKLRHEMFFRRKGGPRSQLGFPLLFVVYIAILGVALGYLLHL